MDSPVNFFALGACLLLSGRCQASSNMRPRSGPVCFGSCVTTPKVASPAGKSGAFRALEFTFKLTPAACEIRLKYARHSLLHVRINRGFLTPVLGGSGIYLPDPPFLLRCPKYCNPAACLYIMPLVGSEPGFRCFPARNA